MHDLPWQAACVMTLGLFLIVGGTIAFIVGLVQDEQKRRRNLRRLNSPYFRSMDSDYYRVRK